ncbi:MAG TPA: carbohydrate ABC transporter permease [Clostridia bacterium]|nr:carbohydrate ABC transporter permease [Clostridia bacterium]
MLLLMALCTLYPFWYVLCMALSDYQATLGKGLLFLPAGFTLANLRYILSTPDFLRIYGNTGFVVGMGTFLSLTFTTMFAYGLARRVPGKTWIAYAVFFTLLFSGGMIPTFLVVRGTKLMNTLWALIVPRVIDPFNIFLMRNFFQSIPDSLDESASVEGAGPMTILLKIILPISLPGLATIALFYGVGYWNAFFDAVIYISSRERWTIQVLLRELLVSMQPDILGSGATAGSADNLGQTLGYTVKMATVVTAIVPIMCIYPFLQRYFVKGVIVGAVKG